MNNQSTQIKYSIVLATVLALTISMLFQESFQGLILQGVDDNISMRQVIVRSLLSGQGYHFIPNYWLGFIFNVPNPDFYNSILALTGSVEVVWVYVLALFLSGFLMFHLLMRLQISPISSIFGAVSYTFLPHVLSLVYSGHALALESIPMLPGFLLCLSIIFDGKTASYKFKIPAAVWVGIFWAWMMIGEPQRGIYGSVLGFAWVVFLLFHTDSLSFKFNKLSMPKLFKEKLIYLVVAMCVGLAIFLSTIKFWTNSEFLANKGSWDFATSWSFPPSELLDTFAFGYHGLSTYDSRFPYYGQKPLSGNTDSLGFFLLLFTIFASVFASKIKNNVLVFFLISGFTALLLSFGKYFPGTPFFWLWYHLPGMDKLRVPAKFLSITGFSWSIAAAFALDYLKTIFQNDLPEHKKLKQIILISLIASFVLSLLWFIVLALSGGGEAVSIRKVLGRSNRALIDAALTTRVNSVISMTGFFASVSALFAWGYFKPRVARFIPAMVILLTLLNLYSANRYYIQNTYVEKDKFYVKTPLIQFLEKNLTPLHRASGSFFVPNMTGSPAPIGSVIEQGLYSENNYDLTYAFPYFDLNMFGRIPISRIDDNYFNFFKSIYDSVPVYQNYSDVWTMNKRLWFAANVKYILVGAEIEELFKDNIAQDAIFISNFSTSAGNPLKVFELKEILPRFALFNNVKSVPPVSLFQEFTFALQNMDQFMLPVEESGIPIPADLFPKAPQIPVVKRINYNAYEITINDSLEDQILYFGDLFDSGWNALVDGESMPIYRANGIQQYVFIPKGTQTISLFYHKPVRGLLFSRIFILLSILAVFAGWIFYIYKNYKINSMNKKYPHN